MRLTRRFIIRSLNKIGISDPIKYERYYVSDNLRIQSKNQVFEKEILDCNNNIIKKENISENEFNIIKKKAYSKIIRNSYLYLYNDNISIKEYLGEYEGLIRVEVKFNTIADMNNYKPEYWMGKEITDSPLAFDKFLSKLTHEEFLMELEKYI